MTDKQTLFIEHYLTHFNATRAATEAGYSEDTAASIGWENLRKPEIREEIERIVTDAMGADRHALSYRIIQSLKDIAFAESNIDELIANHDGDVVGVNKRDRLKALELLGKYRALFTDRLIVDAKVKTENTTFVIEKED